MSRRQVQPKPESQPISRTQTGSHLHENGLIRRQVSSPSVAVPEVVQNGLRSSGQPLESDIQTLMESRFEHDFSHVRVHTNSQAAQSAQAMNAKAYTVNQNIVFGPGQYAPKTLSGQQLLAHELTHVVQTHAAASNPTRSSSVAALEHEARQAARAVASGDLIPPIRGVAQSDTLPLRADSDDVDTATFGNLPQDVPDPGGMRKRVVLVEEKGQWYEKRPNGERFRAQGSYDFVVQKGKIWAVKGSRHVGGLNPGHTEAAAGGRVEYAGTVRFGSGANTRGKVQEWSNASGHYAPVSYFAKKAGLSMDKFKPVEGGFPDKGPQLPVFQPKKGESFSPRSLAGSVAPSPVPGPIPPPPEWVTAKLPVSPTAPPAVVTTNDPLTVAKLYSPHLVQQYRSQQLLYQYSQAALDQLEVKELSGALSEEDKQKKAILSAQVAIAQALMLQARKDYEMLNNPATAPQQLQEMFARRGIAIPVVPQTDKKGAAALQGSGLSAWNLDDKGFTKKSGMATTRTILDRNGNPVTITDEDSSSTNIGFGTAKRTTGTKVTAVQGETSTVVDITKSTNLDLIKGEASVTKERSKQATDPTGITTTTSDKSTVAVGLSGITKTRDESTQVGNKLDSKGSSFGLSRAPGQLGLTAGNTTRSGTMIGPPDAQKMDEGREKTNKLTGGLVSDDKGTGVGGLATQDRKTLLGDGKSVSTTIAAGGRYQALVKEVPGSAPPKFTITSTIAFDLKLGATAGKEWEAKPGAQRDTGLKGNVSAGGSAAIGIYASFKRELTATEAQVYLDFVKVNGRGSSLPEHRILATGAAQGWDAAKQLWQAMNGSPQTLRSLKPGEAIETNAEVGGDAKVGGGGGESRQGGLSVGGEATVKAKHKINVSKSVLPDGLIQVTATIDDEGELGLSGSGGMGAASARVGKSWTEGQGRAIVFILDPKDPAFDTQLIVIDRAMTPADLDRVAAQNRSLVAAKTDKQVAGEGTSVGASVGPVSIDLGGKGRLTSEVTRDQAGQVIGAKYTGENQGGGTIGLGDVKVGDSKTETYVGELDKEGRAKGELSQTKKSTSVSKTVLNAGGKITSDPLGTLMSPSKLIQEETEQKGTAIADPEIMSICYAALNPSKWDWKVGGHRHDEWVKTGTKIRNACTVRGSGREAEIVQVNKQAVQQALAEWTKADVEGRKEVLDTLIRPLGGLPSGKAFAFPDNTASIKADWDALVVADPLVGARAKLAAQKSQEALAEMQAVKSRISSLYARVNSAAKMWEGLELQHAEMLGHINNRINEVDTAIRNLVKMLPAAPQPNAPAAVTPVPTAAAVKEQEGRDRANEARADLEIYNNNIEVMKGYADAVFKKLGQAEAKINDDGFFSGSKSSRIIEAIPVIKEAEDLLKLWDALYWPTFRLYEKWSPYIGLDKARIEKLHTAGARGRWQQVYNLTRDPSMAGR